MKISVSISGLKQSRWHEYGVRFLFGGLVTALAGLVAKMYGPAVGGLFMAFPAIFPATATLIEKHERERKAKRALNGSRRAQLAVAADSAGAAIGCLGLGAFAGCSWLLLPRHSMVVVLVMSAVAWSAVSAGAWFVWKRI